MRTGLYIPALFVLFPVSRFLTMKLQRNLLKWFRGLSSSLRFVVQAVGKGILMLFEACFRESRFQVGKELL